MTHSTLEAEWANRSIETKRAFFASNRFVSFRFDCARNETNETPVDSIDTIYRNQNVRRFDSIQIESIMAPVVSIDKISIEWWQAHVKLKLVSATRFQISLFTFLCSKPYFPRQISAILESPTGAGIITQCLLRFYGSGLTFPVWLPRKLLSGESRSLYT